MAKKGKRVHHVIILDASHSMLSVADVTISGLNEQFDLVIRQAKNDKADEQLVTFVRFNHEYFMDLDAVAAKKLKPYNLSQYSPNGTTALNDAIGRTVAHVEAAAQKGDKVILTVFTDGEENASKDYTRDQVAEKLKHVQSKLGWTVTYVGANHDVSSTAKALNIPLGNTVRYSADHVGTSLAMRTLSTARLNYMAETPKGSGTTMFSNAGTLDLTFPDKTLKKTDEIYAVTVERHA